MTAEGSVLTWHQAIFLKQTEIKPRFPDERCLDVLAETNLNTKTIVQARQATRSTDVHDLVDIMGINGLRGEKSSDFFGNSSVDR